MTQVPHSNIEIRGKKLQVSYTVGKLLHADKRTSTQISGGHVYSYGNGHVSSTPLRVSETQHSQLFVRTASGQEIEVNIANAGLGFRSDQWITLLSIEDKEGWNHVGVLNHGTLSKAVWPSRLEAFVPGIPRFHLYVALLSFTISMLAIMSAAIADSDASGKVGIAFLLLAAFSLAARFAWRSSVSDLEHRLDNILAGMQQQVRSGAWTPPF